jgi:hypothetical protein
MTSERKLRANRKNAERSTGPRTAAGKARSARNARKHGLSMPICSDQQLAAEANDLARCIAGDQLSSHLAKSSRAVAEAELDILRAQRFRLDLLRRVFPGRTTVLPAAPELTQDPIQQGDGVISPPDRQDSAGLRPAETDVLAFADLTRQLETADRYERRAASRRKFAIRDFDTLRHLQINAAEDGAGRRKRRAAENLIVGCFGKTNPVSVELTGRPPACGAESGHGKKV